MTKYKRLICNIGLGVCIVVLAAIAVFTLIRYQGKKNLEEEIVNGLTADAAGGDDSYKEITYNGQEYRYRDNLINIVCMGIDKDEAMDLRDNVGNSVGQSDAIFVLSIDLENEEMRILAIPRDTIVMLQMYDGEGHYVGSDWGQLTLQYAYGDGQELSATLLAGQVSGLLHQIPMNAYVAINLSSLPIINDAVGGVDITMTEDFTWLNPAFKEGETVHLEGELVEAFIRRRDTSVAGSAYTRIDRQKQYMKAFFSQAKNALKEDPTLPLSLMKTIEYHMETDLTADEVLYLATEAVDCDFSTDNMYILPGEIVKGDIYEEYQLDEEAVMELVIDLFYEVK